jgi:hypothetical protein
MSKYVVFKDKKAFVGTVKEREGSKILFNPTRGEPFWINYRKLRTYKEGA